MNTLKITFLTKYDHAEPKSPHGGVSMTDQQYRDECDIDVILKRYKLGQPLPINQRVGQYGDFSDVGSFGDCLDRVNAAIDHFNELPAVVRDRFGNDPRAFYEFALNPSNIDECRKLGLASPAEVISDKETAPAQDGAGSDKSST